MRTTSFYTHSGKFSNLLKVLFLFFIPVTISAQSGVTVCKETIGNYAGTINVTSYTGWANGNLVHSVTAGTVRVLNTVIPSDYPGASGGTPVKINGNSTWQISGINTTGIPNLTLSFGIHKSNANHSGAGLIIEVSSDGVVYTPLTWSVLPVGNGTGDTWFYRTGGTEVLGSIPATNNLRIRFRNTAVPAYDIDDIEIKWAFALPLHLVDFNAQRNGSKTDITWTTADEENVDHFEVQRSDNGTDFTTIQKLDARNRGNEEKYNASDLSPIKNKAYYRLMSVDNDGKTNYSKIVGISSKNSAQTLSVTNASAKEISIIAPAAMPGKYQYSIISMNGQILQKGELAITAGANRIALNATVNRGVYVIHIGNSVFEQQLKTSIQ